MSGGALRSFQADDREIRVGNVFHLPYPFVHEQTGDPENPWRWKPGTEIEESQYGTDVFAHGKGKMILVLIDIHRPGSFPTRAFYTRQFIAPDGREFRRSGLRMTTTRSFANLVKGYRYSYDNADEPLPLAGSPPLSSPYGNPTP